MKAKILLLYFPSNDFSVLVYRRHTFGYVVANEYLSQANAGQSN